MRQIELLLRRERGQVLLLVALLATVLVGILALVVDGGFLYVQRRQAQNGADEAALSAVYELTYGGSAADATQAALQNAAANGFDNDGASNTVTVNSPPLSGEHVGDPNFVEVIVTENPTTFFIHVLVPGGGSVSARGVAGFNSAPGGPASDASIITLNQSDCASLTVNANGAFTAEGPILINSNCPQYAATFGCNGQCQALGGIESVGGVETDENCSPCNVTTAAPFPDPLAGVLPPCFPNSPTPCENVDDLGNPGSLTVRNGPASDPQKYTDTSSPLLPGIYYGGIDINPNESLVMMPGVYVIAGGGFKVNSNASFTANGIYIYNTNDPDCPFCGYGDFGQIILSTNDVANLTPMTTGAYAGLLMFQDRNNTEKAVFAPNDSLGKGTVYIPSAEVDISPNDNMALQVIADTINVNNNDNFIAHFDGTTFYQGLGNSGVALVE